MGSDIDEGYGPPIASGSDAVQRGYLERRAHRRFPIQLEFELFHLWGASHLVWAGSGRTANWSRSSILIPWNKPLSVGSSVELVVRWSSGMQLIIVGRVINVETRGVVVKIMRRRFRGKPEFPGTLPAGDPVDPPVATPGRIRAS